MYKHTTVKVFINFEFHKKYQMWFPDRPLEKGVARI